SFVVPRSAWAGEATRRSPSYPRPKSVRSGCGFCNRLEACRYCSWLVLPGALSLPCFCRSHHAPIVLGVLVAILHFDRVAGYLSNGLQCGPPVLPHLTML